MDSVSLVQPVKAQQTTYLDDFKTDTGNWRYLGSANRDQLNQNLVLTNSSSDQTGIAIFKAPIRGSFVANFSFICMGSASDGLVMFFYKQDYPQNIDYTASYGANGVAGGRTGFNSLTIIPGYGIEFDGWQNIAYEFANIAGGQPNPSEDPNNNHIALIKDFTGNHLAWIDSQTVCSNDVWHQVSVQVQGSSIVVFVDQKLVLQWSGTIDRTYDGFGFSGSNGQCLCNTHIIDNFSITARDLHTPVLTVSCISATAQQTFNVYTISGDLTFNGVGISGAPIYVSDSVNGGEFWQDLTLIYTDSNGGYSAMWLPTVTGNYMLKAAFRGDENYLVASNTISFAIQPSIEQNVFSITSNSTITALTFDPVIKQLSFNVSGANGTSGYTYVFIPKALLNDTAALNVRLDGNPIDYTTQSQNDGWLLYFSYHHSMHRATIGLGSSVSSIAGTSGFQFNVGDLILIAVSAAIVLFASVLVVALRAWKKNLVGSETKS